MLGLVEGDNCRIVISVLPDRRFKRPIVNTPDKFQIGPLGTVN